jgi:hypothetical protein
MRAHFGHLHWWPGEMPFEVCLGAILSQNTSWSNVERAIANLKAARVLPWVAADVRRRMLLGRKMALTNVGGYLKRECSA